MTVPSGRIQLFARTASDPIRWRLLSNNNREIGRSVDSFEDVEVCRIAVKELQANLEHLDRVVRRAGANSWIWVILDGDRPVVAAAHGYDRQIRCGRGLAHFVQEMGLAPVTAEVMTSHARRWGGSVA
jgi:hypothetical protein